MSNSVYGKVLKENLFTNNAILVQVLGICSTLAVTNSVVNTLIMGFGVTFATAMSSMTLSAMNSLIPRKVRMIVQVVVISFYVIIIDLLLKAFAYETSKTLGPYVGLIITNCIIMGRAEAFAQSNRPMISFWDGLTSGLGYTMILTLLAIIREFLGFGTLATIAILPSAYSESGSSWLMMIMAPSAFFLVGIILWVSRTAQFKKSGGPKNDA